MQLHRESTIWRCFFQYYREMEKRRDVTWLRLRSAGNGKSIGRTVSILRDTAVKQGEPALSIRIAKL
jgi:hypothetical protein